MRSARDGAADAALFIQIRRAGFRTSRRGAAEAEARLCPIDVMMRSSRNEAREGVQTGGLSGARSTGNENRRLGLHTRGEKAQHPRRQRLVSRS